MREARVDQLEMPFKVSIVNGLNTIIVNGLTPKEANLTRKRPQTSWGFCNDKAVHLIYQKMSSHAQIGPQGAEKQLSKVNVVVVGERANANTALASDGAGALLERACQFVKCRNVLIRAEKYLESFLL